MFTSVFKEFNPKGFINDDNKRLRYIDAAYFIGVFLVVLGHAHPLTGAWHDTWLKYMNGFIYSFHMHLYFFIAGYLLVHSKSIDKLGYKKWAVNKILKFGVPYIVLTVIAFLPKYLIGTVITNSDTVDFSLGYFLQTTFIKPRAGVWGHFWFITAYLPIDLIWGFWRAYSPKNKWIYRFGLFFGLIVSLIIAVFPIATDIFTLYDISEVAIFYCLGVFTALFIPKLWDKKYKLLIGLVVTALIAWCLFPNGNFMIHRFKSFNLTNIINQNVPNYDLKNTALIDFIVSLSLVWFCWCLANLIGRIKWFNLPQKVAPYIFIVFLYGWPAQATLEALFRLTSLHWLPITIVLFFAGYFVPIFIVWTYRKMEFLHCKFFDYLIGVDTSNNK